MLAEKFILRADQEGRLTGLPALAANEEVEVIVLRQERRASSAQTGWDLEQAYRDANLEIDPAWEIVAADGLADERKTTEKADSVLKTESA
jgi:hypothetical protein